MNREQKETALPGGFVVAYANVVPKALTPLTRMRRAAAFALLLAPGPLAAQNADPADPIVGSWRGMLQVQPGVELLLMVHIAAGEEGYTGTLDSPDQGATGIPVGSVAFTEGRLTFELPLLGADYEGTLTPQAAFDGVWRQGGGELPLLLERSRDEPTDRPRPQHPEPPFPYEVEEVRFLNPGAGIHLAGTLTLPEGEGPFPALALVTGSGPQDRDETLLGHKPFLVIADHLARHGVAVLRYDDRGVAESEGDFASATSVDFAWDAAAAVEFLHAHPRVDPARVGLGGHSEGGLIAPMVATGITGMEGAEPTPELAFVVLLAGPGLPGEEILSLQGAAIGRASGMSEETVELNREVQRRFFQAAREEHDPERLRERAAATLAELDAEARASVGVPSGQEEAFIQAQVAAMSTPWFRYFLDHDPRPALEALRIPVLALFGEKDLQVPAKENRVAMQAALEVAGNPDATLVVLPDLNHLFQTSETGSPTEYAPIEETFSPVALEAITSWILARFDER